MVEQNRIRFSSIISDPESYISEMFQLHPGAKHDKDSGYIEIKNEIINSSFRYQLLEEGLFLFSFSSFSPVDAEYNFIPNPSSDYFTLVFYFTEERTKNPLYIKTEDKFYSTDQFSMFFNGNMTAEIFIKAKQKANGLRLDIHKKWLLQNIEYPLLSHNNLLRTIIDFKSKGYVQENCQSYSSIVNNLISIFEKESFTLRKLQLRAKTYKLIHSYLDEIIQYSKESEKKKEKLNTGELRSALNYLEKKIHEDFPGNSYLAQICNISESSFNKKFKTTFNISPAHYFASLKMKEALRLLQIGHNVKDVAYKVGYKDTSSFGRSFKQYFGKSPAAYVKS